ncbi:hypothetical protein GYA27_03355 [candidate division WWE3 bacterium]|uniref:Nudix hydrolase domain-containing protein n=1 Tax=candidate division WWE3 bacterium TaxID=2053526 RepID=A0A7X9HI35_UNCKA|nr:hypothetical protein [candidate division WWE3 bacterium]
MPTLQELNEDRQNGFRPSVLCCVINENTVLILFNKEYNFWMFPQGGIENHEDPEKSIFRALHDDFGDIFMESCAKDYIYLGSEQVEFAPGKHNITELKTDEGAVVEPKGKKYYFYALYKTTQDLNLSGTPYSEYFWLGYKAGSFLAAKIPQKGKKRITLKAMELLKEKGLIG